MITAEGTNPGTPQSLRPRSWEDDSLLINVPNFSRCKNISKRQLGPFSTHLPHIFHQYLPSLIVLFKFFFDPRAIDRRGSISNQQSSMATEQ